MTQPTLIDLFSPAFKTNPYPTYAHLRSTAPIHRATLPDGQPLWLVTRYEDVVAVLKDERFVKDFRKAMTSEQLAQLPPVPKVFDILSHNMLDLDPPDHTRLRALVSKAFTPRMIAQLQPRIQTIADALLDAVQDKGEMDLIDDYAFPLPITVIAELLGVPVADRNKFRAWSNTLVSGTGMVVEEAAVEAATAFVDYLRTLFAERRAHPTADLISALVQVEEAGDKLSDAELYAMVFLLLVAGHETTVNLIGNGTLALLQHPDQLELLKRDPSRIESAVEELLRYDGPVETSTSRFAREDIDFNGTLIPKGEAVLVVIAAAGHDPDQFINPDTLDITRVDNKHLAFGKGIHYCLGAPLARLEGQIAIGTLLRRLPSLRLNVALEVLIWRPGLVLRGLKSLPVAF
jgi:cytochrome P450